MKIKLISISICIFSLLFSTYLYNQIPEYGIASNMLQHWEYHWGRFFNIVGFLSLVFPIIFDITKQRLSNEVEK
jgi:hypothetical protein